MTVLEATQRGLILFGFVFMILSFLWGIIILFSRGIELVEKKSNDSKRITSEEGLSTNNLEKKTSNQPQGPWGGELILNNVDEQTAAIIMAIVSDEAGIPLSELIFKRISLKEDK